MNGQEYLDQISTPKQSNKILDLLKSIVTSKIFIVAIIGIVILIITMVVISIIGDMGNAEDGDVYALSRHIEETSKVIEKYKPYIKSSSLRADTASLSGVLSNTNSELTSYINNMVKYHKSFVKLEVQAENDALNLDSDLSNAKISGILDRIFAHKMAYEISTIMMEESKLLKSESATLRRIMGDSRSSLENVYNNFNNYSETK